MLKRALLVNKKQLLLWKYMGLYQPGGFRLCVNVKSLFQVVTAAPQKFKIDILPVDDGTPRIVTNLGLQWLEYMENKVNLRTIIHSHLK